MQITPQPKSGPQEIIPEIVTQEIVERFERKIERNKSLKLFEIFLERLRNIEFSSNELLIKFIHLLRKAEFTNKELYLKILNVFRMTNGLPQEAFDEEAVLVANDLETCIPFSKELLTQFSNYFKMMFNTGLLETRTNRSPTMLSKEALLAFKTYLYKGKLEPGQLDVYKELLNFAQMIENDDLQEKATQEIFNYFLDENNEIFFDRELLEEQSKEFTKQYLEKKKIKYQFLTNDRYAIALSSFVSLFSGKDSKVFPLIVKEIDGIWIDKAMVLPPFLSKKYRQAIIQIVETSVYAPFLKELENLLICFPNARLPNSFGKRISKLKPENNAFYYLNLGKRHLKEKQFSTAEQHLHKALELDPKNAQAHITLGKILLKQDKLDDAPAFYRETIKMDPQNSLAYRYLGSSLIAQENLHEAEICLRKAIKQDPKDVSALGMLADVLRDTGKIDEALVYYLKAIDRDSKISSLHASLGDALIIKERLDDAEASFREAIKLDLEDPYAYAKLGNVLTQKGVYDEAEVCWREAIECEYPQLSYAHAHLGEILHLQDKGREAEAEASAREAIKLDPQNFYAHGILADVLSAQNKVEEAEACLREAISLNPENGYCYVDLGEMLHEQGRLDEAETLLREAIKLNPEISIAHEVLGDILKIKERETHAGLEITEFKPQENFMDCEEEAADEDHHERTSESNSLSILGKRQKREEKTVQKKKEKSDLRDKKRRIGNN